jgi:hypothetical protein
MGEIKSTLDLVMEKTKDLNLSDAEKQEQKNKEIESRLRGLVQKYQDEIISQEQFKAEYEELREDYSLQGTQHEQLLNILCARIGLGKDNQVLLDLLSQFADTHMDGLTSVLRDFDTAIQTAAAAQRQSAKDTLASVYHICGSAVLPNLESDPAWRKMTEEIRSKYREFLNQSKTKLLAG